MAWKNSWFVSDLERKFVGKFAILRIHWFLKYFYSVSEFEWIRFSPVTHSSQFRTLKINWYGLCYEFLPDETLRNLGIVKAYINSVMDLHILLRHRGQIMHFSSEWEFCLGNKFVFYLFLIIPSCFMNQVQFAAQRGKFSQLRYAVLANTEAGTKKIAFLSFIIEDSTHTVLGAVP